MRASRRPTIAINGSESPILGAALQKLTVIDDGVRPSRCEARFNNWGPVGTGTDGYLFFDRRVLDFDARLRVLLSGVSVFDGAIVALNAGFPEAAAPTLAVRAEDRVVATDVNVPPIAGDPGTITLVRGRELRDVSVQDDSIAQRHRVARGTCEATPAIHVGAVVDLQGIGEFFSGLYRVAEVRHTFDHSDGLTTSFCAEAARRRP